MSMIKKISQAVVVALSLTSVSLPLAADEVRGLEIAKERKQRDEGWGDTVSELTMVLQNAAGDTSQRKLRINTLEIADDGDKGLTIFDEPRDVRGTVFLNYSHVEGPDDQWLYLPALKRVKRIASRNKSGPFMGSEFAYEDLSSFELEKYSFNYLGDEQFAGVDSYLVEQIPTDKYSGYTRQKVWLDKEHYRPLKVEFYDRRDTLLKTLTFEDYQQYLNQYWRAHEMVMQNHQTGKVTTLTTSKLAFNTGLEEKDFSKSSLKRAR
ncbi:outer membrane lipoprotein-sorting protein [Enterovibrio coralii]|uniref:Uncharacterized protein TP-0789 domain-containing protein n=1 Tax=Enterovibrio coralii TaxID=294935 RepID=A0A135I837_9GAMM|nr:outer membrane lipoprotein-sorting protein [Enterovibrio coralii]KXF81613.1 hypothetical protein ATN88_02755 [Enterovibrio coralii]